MLVQKDAIKIVDSISRLVRENQAMLMPILEKANISIQELDQVKD